MPPHTLRGRQVDRVQGTCVLVTYEEDGRRISYRAAVKHYDRAGSKMRVRFFDVDSDDEDKEDDLSVKEDEPLTQSAASAATFSQHEQVWYIDRQLNGLWRAACVLEVDRESEARGEEAALTVRFLSDGTERQTVASKLRKRPDEADADEWTWDEEAEAMPAGRSTRATQGQASAESGVTEASVSELESERDEEDSGSDEEVYTVEKIVAERESAKRGKEYRVKWSGYGSDEDTWEPEEHLKDNVKLAEWKRRPHRRDAESAVDEVADHNGSDDGSDVGSDDGSGEEEDDDDDASRRARAPVFRVGQLVKAMYLASTAGTAKSPGWWPGTVVAAHRDGTYDVDYNDGDEEKQVLSKFIRALPSASSSGGGSGAGGRVDNGGEGGEEDPEGSASDGGRSSYLRCQQCGAKKQKDSFSSQMKRGEFGKGGILKCLHCSTHQRAGKNASVRQYEAQAARQRAEADAADEETPAQARRRERADAAHDRARRQPRTQRRSHGTRGPRPQSASEPDSDDDVGVEANGGGEEPRGRAREAALVKELEKQFGRRGTGADDDDEERAEEREEDEQEEDEEDKEDEEDEQDDEEEDDEKDEDECEEELPSTQRSSSSAGGGGRSGAQGGGGGSGAAFAYGVKSSVVWLECPYEEKDAAKSHGAQWDPDSKRWYVPPEVELRPFSRWIRSARTYLSVPPPWVPGGSEAIKAAKNRGAKFDGKSKRWYVPGGTDLLPFAPWR